MGGACGRVAGSSCKKLTCEWIRGYGAVLSHARGRWMPGELTVLSFLQDLAAERISTLFLLLTNADPNLTRKKKSEKILKKTFEHTYDGA